MIFAPSYPAVAIRSLIVLFVCLTGVRVSSAETAAPQTFNLVRELTHDLRSVRSIAFDREDKGLWVKSFQGKVSRVSLENAEAVSAFTVSDGFFETPVQFDSSTETMLRLGDGFVEKVDLSTGSSLSRFEYEPYAGFSSLYTVVSGDGKYLLRAEPIGKAAELVDLERKEKLSAHESSVVQPDLADYLSGFHAAAVASETGKHVLSTFDTLYFFSREGKILWQHAEPGIARLARFSRDGSRLATGPYEDKKSEIKGDGPKPSFLALRGLDDGQILKRYDVVELNDFVFSNDGRLLLIRDDEKRRLRIWDLEQDALLLTLQPDGKNVAAYAFSQDGSRLVVSLERGDGRVGSFAVFQQGGSPEPETEEVGPDRRLVTQSGHSALVRNIAVSPDGKLMASGDASGFLWLWHLQTRRAIRSTALPGKGIEDLLFLDEETVLFLTNEVPYLWDVVTGDVSLFEPMELHSFNGFGIERFGDLVWFWDLSTVTVYDTKNVKIHFSNKTVYEEFGELVDFVEVSPAGREFVVASGNRLHRFDTQSGQSLGHLSVGDKDGTEIHDVAYDAEGNRLFAAVAEKTEGLGSSSVLIGWQLSASAETKGNTQLVRREMGDTRIYDLWTNPTDGTLIATGGDERYWVLDEQTAAIASEAKWLPVEQRLAANFGVEFTAIPGSSRAIVRSGGAFIQLSSFDFQKGEWIGGFMTEISPLNAVKFSDDGTHLFLSSGGAIHVWSLEEGQEIKRLPSSSYNPDFDNVASNENGILTLTQEFGKPAGQNGFAFRFWNPGNGDRLLGTFPEGVQKPQTGEFILNHARKVQFSPNNDYIVMLGSGYLSIWRVQDGSVAIEVYEHFNALNPVVLFSEDERFVTLKLDKFDEDFTSLATWDLDTGKEVWRTRLPSKIPGSIQYSRSGKAIEVRDNDGGIVRIYDAANGKLTEERDLREHGSFVRILDALPDLPDFVASTWLGHAKLMDSADLERRVEFAGQAQIIAAAASHDGKLIATADTAGKVVLRDSATAVKKLQMDAQAARGNTVRFSPDDVLLAVVEEDGGVSLWDTFTGEKLVSLMSLASLDGRESWLTVSPDGRYDADDPGDVAALSWIRRDAPLQPLPVSVFYRDYYEPRLLPRILALEEFPDVRDIKDINIEVPDISIEEVREQQRGLVSVTVAVGRPDQPIASDDFSLKLFRDRQLVGQYPDPTSEGSRLNSRVETRDGQTLVTFSGIKTPASADIDDIRSFSAYAFNADGVKGERSTLNYQYKAETEIRDPKAYVITIGVNAYQNAAWNLKYAVADADAINMTVSNLLKSGPERRYRSVVPISLVAAAEDGRPLTATKRHIKAVIDVLAGRKADQQLLSEIDGAEDLETANPEDLVILTYSGHGYADPRGAFHIFPWDIGTGNDRVVSPELLSKSVTSEMLSDWLYPVDAGHTVIILDACNSAAVVETRDFKPGPMNSRSLGQLAYDKGMQILTASQAENVALESGLIQHGLLTYALIKEGLDNLEADHLPSDQKITLSEWLTYGSKRVPDLYRQVRNGELEPLSRGAITLDTIIHFDDEETNVQKPSLFDFYRGKQELVLSLSSLGRQ